MTAYESKSLAELPLPVRRRVEWHLDRAVSFIVALACATGRGMGCKHGTAQGSLIDGQASMFNGGKVT